MKTIDALDKPTKQQLAGELEKSIAATPEKPAPASSVAPAAPGATPGATPAAPGATSPATPPAQTATPTSTPAQEPAAGSAPATPPAPAAKAPAPETPPAAPSTAPAPTGGKLTQAQQDAMKAKLQGQRAAGKTTASQTGSGFKDYVGGSQTKLAGADASGAPVFKKLQRESVGFSKFLGVHI
jgi:hypothetical protein